MKRTLQEVINYMKLTQDQIVLVSPEQIGISANVDYTTIDIVGVSTDTRTIKKNELFVPLIGEKFDGHKFRRLAFENGSIVSIWNKRNNIPNIPGMYLLVDDTLEALQLLAHEYRQSLPVKVIAITGSNGKTSTKDYVASVLKQCYNVSQTKGNLNNHIGVPLTLLSIQEDDDYAVIELGMNHYGEIRTLAKMANPNFGIITNIGESHIENFGTKENIGIAKFELLYAMESGVAIVNWDDPIINNLVNDLVKAKEIEIQKFGIHSNDLDFSAELMSTSDSVLSDTSFKVSNRFSTQIDEMSIRTPGVHNVYNALAAITIGLLTKIPIHFIRNGLATVKMTSMRMEIVKYLDSYIINDAYNASPTSMKAAISFLAQLKEKNKKVLLLGDMKELGEQSDAYHRDIGQFLSQEQVDMVIAYGEKAIHYTTPLLNSGKNNNIEVLYLTLGQEEQVKSIIEKELNKGCILLVKGSRSMRLERFIMTNTHGSSMRGE